MNQTIHFSIDGRNVSAAKGESILTVARREGIYIPTMCYLSKTTPCASCRMCVVEVKDVEGFVLSCNTPPTPGIEVITNTQALEQERTNIMKLYDVNHPLQCGVCDKSGECDLQNKSLEFGVGGQNFSAQEQPRSLENWGLIDYDPALCIMCEKCVHVCNEVIGDDAIELQFGGYNSKIVPKNTDALECTFCGECIAVCPVGALVDSKFKYSSNAWELKRIPATCAHCSAGCALEYEVKHAGIAATDDTIYRVKNDFEYTTLCGAGRFGFDFNNKAEKNEESFAAAITAIEKTKAIRFSSIITNEEALLLQRLKEQHGVKLINEDARRFAVFMDAYAKISGKKHYSASLKTLKNADGIVMIGSMIATDNPGVRYAMTTAARHNGAKIIYAHPVEDPLLQNTITQFLKYEVGTEEGVMALLAKYLLQNAPLNESEKNYFDALDDGYLSAESNIGEDELALTVRSLMRSKHKVLVIGSDLFAHDAAKNIARLAALIEKYSDFSLLVVPREVNTLGVSLICDLDEPQADAVGYNAPGSFVLSSLPEADLAMPALNQQEGTLTTIDKRVVPTNVAIAFGGYTLNDVVNAFGIGKKETIAMTPELPSASGFLAVNFDALQNYYSALGDDTRGYLLEEITVDADGGLEDVDELPEFNGTILYNVNPVLQFNEYTNCAANLEKDTTLRGSAQFAAAARVQDGDSVEFTVNGKRIVRTFKQIDSLKGTVALNPTFDLTEEFGVYRFQKSTITRVSHE
jgi:NADH-quinone oxidoreductase subunit G